MISENWWLKDQKVIEWFRTVKNKRTRTNYERQFPIFLSFVQQNTRYKTPSDVINSRRNQLSSQYLNEKRFWETAGVKFKDHLILMGYRKSTVAAYLKMMLSFFNSNHMELEYPGNELLGDVEPTGKARKAKEWIPSNEDLRILYRVAHNSQERSVLLALYQSGFSVVDLCNLRIEDFQFYDYDGNWRANTHQYIVKLRKENSVLQQTFLSIECIDELKMYLQGRGYPTKGYLFVSNNNKPLSSRNVNDMIKEIVKKAFNKQVKEWKTKDLRESFLNALAKARVPPEIRNVFVGNLRPKAQRGYGYTESALRPLYEEAFKFLSINGIGSQSRKLMELEQTFKTVMAKNREVFSNGIASLNEKIAGLKEENKQLRQELANIETSLVAMETSQVTTDARLSNLTKRIGDVEENQRLGFDTKYLRDKKEEK